MVAMPTPHVSELKIVSYFRSIQWLASVLLIAIAVSSASAFEPYPGYCYATKRADVIGRYYAAQRPWHGQYAYTPNGMPTALVVPPNAKMHTSFSWGVAQSEMVPLYHQFHRDYPGGMAIPGGATGIYSTPYWPSHTDQIGVYPVRGPW
jgi:hypothetical protein